MNFYYSPSNKGFYVSSVNKVIPNDAVEISKNAYDLLISGQSQGKSISLDEDGMPSLVDNSLLIAVGEERSWRDFELNRSDIELYKVQDSDPKAKGTVSQWREYRKALRAWPDNTNFPDKNFRPVAPDV